MFDFYRENARWLAVGFLMAMGSGFGQTFFIALYADPLRAEFGLSHGGWGAIYMVGTLASAATLIQLGRLADTMPPRRIALAVVLCFAVVCLAMASVAHWIMLIFVIFGLRLMGQGMISHLSQTLTARWFNANRGRALAVASFGYPSAEALAPLAAVALIAAVGWRMSWIAAAAALAFVLAPLLWGLLSQERTPQTAGAHDDPASALGMEGRAWTRGEAIRHPAFWLLFPGVLTPGFLLTVIFFLPSHIADVKGWAFESLPSRYWIYAVCSVAASLLAGFAIDRFGARRCLPLYQLPMAAALVLLWRGQSLESYSAMLALIGLTAGAAATVHAAIWAELYGGAHLGAIKALAHAAMVFSTAAGPGVVGAVIDLGVDFPDQALAMAVWVVGLSAAYAWIVGAGLLGQNAVSRPQAP